VLEKIIGTLTSSILKSVHTSISLIFSYKLYSVATPRHLKPLLLENHVCIIALTLDLQRVSFYSITDFLHYSSTTKLIPSLILIKKSNPSSKALLLYRKSLSAFWLLWRKNLGKVATQISAYEGARDKYLHTAFAGVSCTCLLPLNASALCIHYYYF
jgi:hypothetical protein